MAEKNKSSRPPVLGKPKPISFKPDYSCIRSFNLNASVSYLGQAYSVKTFEYLKEAYEDIQMLLEYSMWSCDPGEITPDAHLLMHASMGITCIKLLRPQGRIASFRALSKQKEILRDELCRNIEAIYGLCNSGFFPPLEEVAHPFVLSVKELSSKPPEAWLDRILDVCNGEKYKKEEAVFIRASNDERKRIRDAMQECIRVKKRMYLLRFDIVSRKIEDYRSHLDLAIERLNAISGKNMVLAVDVIYPRSINFPGQGGPRGHLVVLFKSSSPDDCGRFTRGSDEISGAYQEINVSLVGHFDEFIKGRGHERVLSVSNPESIKLVDGISRFLTVERRLMRVFRLHSSERESARKTNVLRVKKMF